MRRAICVLFTLLLAGVGCSGNDEAQAELDGREFSVPGIVPGTQIIMRFDGDRISASAGCNSMSGLYEIDGGRLVVKDLAQTTLGCDPEREAQDADLSDLLGSRPSIDLVGPQLVLESDRASVQLLDTSLGVVPTPLVGTQWEVDSFVLGPIAQAYTDVNRAEIEFVGGEVMTVFDGCATFRVPIAIEGDRLRFEAPEPPPVENCANPEDYRNNFYTSFRFGDYTYSIAGQLLELSASDGTGMTLRAVQ